MISRILLLALVCIATLPKPAFANECWTLTNLKGWTASSVQGYEFESDKFSKLIILCFEQETGTVSGDDTRFTRFGTSTLAGWAQNRGIELFEVYQIDRTNNRVLFTKSRIGTNTVLPGFTDIVGAFVGDATKLPADK